MVPAGCSTVAARGTAAVMQPRRRTARTPAVRRAPLFLNTERRLDGDQFSSVRDLTRMWAKTLVSTATARPDLDTVLVTSDCTEQGYHPNQQYPVLPTTLPTKYKVPPTRPTVCIDGKATVFLGIFVNSCDTCKQMLSCCLHVCVFVWVVRGGGRCYRRPAGSGNTEVVSSAG